MSTGWPALGCGRKVRRGECVANYVPLMAPFEKRACAHAETMCWPRRWCIDPDGSRVAGLAYDKVRECTELRRMSP